jgi:hypothetical protein
MSTVSLLLLSSVSPLCRVSTLIFLRQTMSLGNTVLQVFWCNYSWCVYRSCCVDSIVSLRTMESLLLLLLLLFSISLVLYYGMSVTVLWTHVDAWLWQYCVTVLYGDCKINQYNVATHNHYECQPLHVSAPSCRPQAVPKHVGVDNVS